jgi:hypothetical protein
LRRRGIAARMVVHQQTQSKILFKEQRFKPSPKITGVSVGDRAPMLDRDKPWRAHEVFVSNRRSHQITDSESISILAA